MLGATWGFVSRRLEDDGEDSGRKVYYRLLTLCEGLRSEGRMWRAGPHAHPIAIAAKHSARPKTSPGPTRLRALRR